MKKRLLGILLLLSSAILFSQDEKSGRPPVIAITGFANFTYPDVSHDIMAIRDKVVSDLVRNYECVIISRSNGFTLATENALGRMNAVSAGATQPVGSIPAADFAITGYFKITKWDSSGITLGCTLLITDFSEKSKADFQKSDFVPSQERTPDITAKIAEMLKLKPKAKAEPVNRQLDETWAILPVSHLESLEGMSKPADKDLAMAMELSLQESRKVKKILDHNDIDKILREFKISSLSGATEGLASGIAGIIGADRVVMGTVSRPTSNGNEIIRIDLLLVDGKKAVVLDSASATCKPGELEGAASNLILELARQSYSSSILDDATQQMRIKECELYRSMIGHIEANDIYVNPSSVDFGISLAEAAYMLVPDNPEMVFGIARALHSGIMCKYCFKTPKPQVQKISDTLDKLLTPESKFPPTMYPLVIRANSYRLSGRYEEAVALAQKHIANYPNVNSEYAYSILGLTYYDMKDYQKALACLEKCKGTGNGRNLGYMIYRKLGNETKELEYLKDSDMVKAPTGMDVLRCLELTRRIEGPEAAIRYSKTLGSWTLVRPEIQVEIAKALIDIGEKDKAVIVLEGISGKDALSRSAYSDKKSKSKLETDIKLLATQLGAAGIQWRKASDIVKVPERYKFYIQPLGKPDPAMIRNAVPKVEEFFGCRVEVLPPAPLPEDPKSFQKDRGQYWADWVLERTARTFPISKDEVYSVFITEKDMFTEKLRFVSGCYKQHLGHIISYSRFAGAGSSGVLTDMLAKTICSSFERHYGTCRAPLPADIYRRKFWGVCTNSQCLMSGNSNAWGARNMKFAICEECQKKLKDIDFATVSSVWQRRLYLNNKLPEEENKWVDDYKAIVHKELRKAEADTGQANSKKAELIPAIEAKGQLRPGISYCSYDFNHSGVFNVNRFAGTLPQKSGIASGLQAPEIRDLKNSGISISAFMMIPEDDTYEFYIYADNGFIFKIGGAGAVSETRHGSNTCSNLALPLKAGLHSIQLSYLQGTESNFKLYWRNSKIIAQIIPDNILFTDDQFLADNSGRISPAPGAPGEITVPEKGFRLSICRASIDEARKQVVWEGRKGDWEGPEDTSADALISLDDKGLTLTVDVTDDWLVGFNSMSYENDSIDLYFDMRPPEKRNEKYENGVFYITAIPYFSEKWPDTLFFYNGSNEYDCSIPGTQIKSAPIDNGYRIQIFLPLEGLKVNHFVPSDKFYFDLAVNDSDQIGWRSKQIMWHGTGMNWKTPKDFGEIKVSDCK